MKRLLSLLLCTIIALTCCSYTVMASENEIKVVLDGRELQFDVPAQVINGRTMVPMRKIFEELGMAVDWDGENQKVMAYKRGLIIELPIDETTIYINSVEQKTDVPAQVVAGRTVVPVRVVSEYAGADVTWDGHTNTVNISSNGKIKHLDWNETCEYWGEVENGRATGFGILYNKETDNIEQMGIYSNSTIILGSDIFESGECFSGTYQDGLWKNGTYFYDSGDLYTGDFVDSKRHGKGTYFYKNGSYHEGEWKNNMPNGYGVFYDATEDIQLQGNFIDGKRDGRFSFNDFYLDESGYVFYDNGVLIDENYIQQQNEANYTAEYDELSNWMYDQIDIILENGKKVFDETFDEALKFYCQKLGASRNYTPSANLDEFVAANAKKKNDAKLAEAEQYAYLDAQAAQKEYEDNALQILDDFLEEQIEELKAKYNIK